MKILLADSSTQVCDRVERLLHKVEGLKIVGKAYTVRDAIVMSDRLKPDVVISEILMNDGSGVTVVRHVTRENSAPLVIMLSNFSATNIRKKYLYAGADFFFDKSFEFEMLPQFFKELQVSVTPQEVLQKTKSIIRKRYTSANTE